VLHSFNPSKSICFDIPNPNIFFAEDEFTIKRAQTICSHCPIRLECLDWALFIEKDLEPEDIWGIYGGLTAMQRVLLSGTDL
jgi:hypothetical protein